MTRALSSNSLYIRLGEDHALNAAVEKLYIKLLTDQTLAHFFENTNMAMLRLHMRIFLTYAFGGEENYTGRNLRSAHEKLVQKKGLSDEHFDRVAFHLAETLRELGTSETLITEVLTIVETTRTEVLNK